MAEPRIPTYPHVCGEETLRARIRELEEALHAIAYEPFGPADASHREVLEAVTARARAALGEKPR